MSCSSVYVLDCHTLASSVSKMFVCGHFELQFYSIKLLHRPGCGGA